MKERLQYLAGIKPLLTENTIQEVGEYNPENAYDIDKLRRSVGNMSPAYGASEENKDKWNTPLTQDGNYALYGFEDDDGDSYECTLINRGRLLIASFEIDAGDAGDDEDNARVQATNKGYQFKIMNTITKIIKDELALDTKHEIEGIMYSPVFKDSESDAEDLAHNDINSNPDHKALNKRDMLYRAYIQKNSPAGSKIITRGPFVTVVFPKK